MKSSEIGTSISKHNQTLEGLRGLCAISVMWTHVFGFTMPHALSPGYQPNSVWTYLQFARGAVLIFFILSGYVIGLTNTAEFSVSAAKSYITRRAVRLLPIYWASVIIGLFAWHEKDLHNFILNFCLLQNTGYGVEPLMGNLPVWSLHFEAFYYLLFLAIWAFRPDMVKLWFVLITAGLIDWFSGSGISLVGPYAIGFLFWTVGLWLSRQQGQQPMRPLFPFVLLLFAANHFDPARVILNGLGFPYQGKGAIWLNDLALLPAAFMIMCNAVGYEPRFRRLLTALAVAVPFSTIGILLVLSRLFETERWIIASVGATLGVVFLFLLRKPDSQAFSALAPIGRISYAIYLFHVPALLFFQRFYPWNGHFANYVVGATLCIGLTFVAAWFAELVVQPFIRRTLLPNRAKLNQTSQCAATGTR